MKHINIFLLSIFVALASCSFTTKTFENPDQEKHLMPLITYLLEEGHFQSKDFNDEFSEEVYTRFLKAVDPYKHYFYMSDIKEFEIYKTDLDDQIKNYDVQFFNLVYNRLTQRIEESKAVYSQVLKQPFNYNLDEKYQSNPDKLGYVSSKNEMIDRWRKQLKFNTLTNYHDLLSANEDRENNDKKTVLEIENDARQSTLKSLQEASVYFDDMRRDDWLSMYVNAISETFDPHTYYFAPQVKDRFDAEMSGKYEGIGARLQKKNG